MDSVSPPLAATSQTLEFTGHLIDSLTLSKVADQIQALGGTFQLNDIRIGVLRNEISSVNLTVSAPKAERLSELIEAMRPYGGQPVGQSSVKVERCPADGALPEDAFAIRLPQRVLHNGQWLTVNNGETLALAIDPQGSQPILKPTSQLRQGDTVVVGTQGIAW